MAITPPDASAYKLDKYRFVDVFDDWLDRPVAVDPAFSMTFFFAADESMLFDPPPK